MSRYLLWGLIVVAILRIPEQWVWLQASQPIWGADVESQYRFLLADVPYEMLREIDGLLPPDTAVLLATAQADNQEYTLFHRALYFLTPRPVWWVAAAPPDETWESRWYLSAPVTAASLTAVAHEKQITCVLTLSPHLAVGEKLAAWAEGALWQVGGECPLRPHPAATITGNWLWAGVGMVILWLAGIVILWLIGFRATGLEKVSLAWIVGTGVVSVVMGWLSVGGVSPRAQVVGLVTAVAVTAVFMAHKLVARRAWRTPANAALLAGVARFSQSVFQIKEQPLTTTIPQTILLLLLFWQIGFVAVLAVARPLAAWDSWANWSIKARMLLQAGLASPLYADASRLVTMPDYPLFLPLVETWLYRWAGAMDDRLAGLVIFLFYLAGIGVMYTAVARWSPRLALVAAVAWASLNTIVTLAAVAYTDVVVAVLALTAVIYLREWQKQQTTGPLLVSLCAIGLLPWAKREGLVIALVICLCALLLHIPPPGQRRRFIIGSLTAVTFLSGFWLIYAHLYLPANPNFLPITAETLWAGIGRLPRISWMMLKLLAGNEFHYLWPLLVVAGLYYWRSGRSHPYHLPLVGTVLYIGLMAATYMVSNYLPYQQHIASSAYRLVAQVAAWPILWLVLWEEKVSASS